MQHFTSKHIFNIILFIVFCCSSNIAKTQSNTVTAYESKIMEITKKYFAVCYFGTNDISIHQKAEVSRDVNKRYSPGVRLIKSLSLKFLPLYALNHSEAETRRLENQIKSELKNAEKLKNSVDFARDKEIERKKKQNRARKEERRKKLKQHEYEKTDFGGIQRDVRKAFKKWNKKGEFEKETDYKERLKNESLFSFNEICRDMILSRISQVKRGYNAYKFDLLKYNIEEEFFPLSYKIHNENLTGKIHVPLNAAPNFKNNWENNSNDERFKLNFNKYKYFLIGDFLYPSELIIKELEDDNDKSVKNKFVVEFSHRDRMELEINFNDLEISNDYLQGYIFNYLFLKEIEDKIDVRKEMIKAEKRKADSLKLLPYNMKLDSILEIYNAKLLRNPYNVDKKVIIDYVRVTDIEHPQNEYERIADIVKSKYDSRQGRLKKDLRKEKPEEFVKIYFELNPSKKEDADKKYIPCRCRYKSKTHFYIEYSKDDYYTRCNCRRVKYLDLGQYYFPSEEEFNKFYDKGDQALEKEIDRITLKRKEKKAIRSLDYQSFSIEKLKLKGVKENLNEEDNAVKVYKLVESYKNETYYKSVINKLIKLNKRMSKEWRKRKTLFSDKIDFYQAYTSSDYKKIIKKRK